MSQIEKREITTELRESYLDYAMSVIVARALPDARDGLKPVQRRILWAMWDSGLTAEVKLRKSANVVGEVLGRYHPHGDTSVYDALARMTQDFSLRYPLIQGQGNWGCFTGDTKVKLTDGRSLSFKELVEEHNKGKRNYAYSFNHQTGLIEIAEIKNPRLTREKTPLVKVVLNNGAEIRCTPDHRFMLRDGSYREARNLFLGDSLMPGYYRFSTKEDDANAIGYHMVFQPMRAIWEWAHRLADEWNLKRSVYKRGAGRIRHHKDFNKLNNNPDNLERMDWKKHWQLHYQMASWRHKNDPEYVGKLREGRKRYISTHQHVFKERIEALNKKLWASPEFRRVHRNRIQAMWGNPEYRARMRDISSATLRRTWQDDSYKKLMSELKSSEMKARWQDPAYRAYWSEKTREISKKLWASEKHRNYISRINRERTNNPEWRKAQSGRAKELWQNPDYRSKYSADHFSQIAKQLWSNPIVKEFHSGKAKKQWQNPDFRKKIGELSRARGLAYTQKNPAHFQLMTEKAKTSLRRNWEDSLYKNRVIRSKILGYAYALLQKYPELTPEIYERERTNNCIPGTEKALKYFSSFKEITEKAPLYNHTVSRVEFLSEKEDVYDLTIDATHNFLLDAGVFVHNSVDGDAPAAMRYTECRLSKIAAELLTDIEKETVPWQPNYDGSRTEPLVLPAKFPNLLLNGTVGIAVGMATSIPPHNLGEVIDAALYLADHPKAATADLLAFIQGPDFPTGGIIYDRKAIAEAYAAGRGSIPTRAVAEIVSREKSGSRENFQIVITEIPYQVNKAELIIKIAELVSEKRVDGIRDIRDESDKEGLRIAIDLKNDAAPQKVLNQLYSHTDLQKDFHLNMIALAGVSDPTGEARGLQPQVMSLKDMLQSHLAHRQIIVRRRAAFDLRKAEERAHILEGLAKALGVIDRVIQTIKRSADRAEAHRNLVKQFRLTDIQTNAILDMRLQTLAALETKKIEDELKEKQKIIAELKALIKSPERILSAVKQEFKELKEKYADPRRTKVVASGLREFRDEDLIPEEEAIITFSESGYIKRLPPDAFRSQRRGGKGLIGSEVGEADFLATILTANTHDSILFFTDRGRVFQTKVYEIPVASRTAKGKPIQNFLEIPQAENVSAIVTHRGGGAPGGAAQYLVMVTKHGLIKKTALSEFGNVRRTGIIAISLKKSDLLKWVRLTGGKDQVIIATKDGQAIRFRETQIRAMGRTAAGVRAIRLRGGDEVRAMDIVPGEKEIRQPEDKTQKLLTVMANGFGKQTALSEFKVQNRGGMGIRAAKITKKTGSLIAARLVRGEEELIALSLKGQVIRTKVAQIRVAGRATQGVKIMTLNAGDAVAGITCL